MQDQEDIMEQLANATEEHPLILEKPLTTEEQVEAFNLNMFGEKMHEDYKYPIVISDNMLKLVEKEKGQWWGTIESVARYSMTNCIDLGYIPWRLIYNGFNKDGLDGGTHSFDLICEDRRINHDG